ncbi:peptidylprolyl isomerase [Betaproteobacteria bacterium PRO7]|jgi:peptidyl-prolyl cis-trans isomerase C|nr:peptidylprolyl isomerase [Betaproteobacteria bacterium PRO7]
MLIRQIRERLLERAATLGIERATEEATIDALLEREVVVPPPTDAECRRYYAQHPARFRAGALAEADHILFAVTDAVPLAPLRERAEATLRELLAAPETFAAKAAELSNCPSGRVGGSLGQIARESVVPEFWQAIEAFGATGIIPKLVETRYGLHVVRVARYVAGDPLPYEAVAERIAAHLADRNLRVALRDYAHTLAHDALDEDAHAH